MTRRAGYSLFEVLVAFAIMALVLAALMPGQAYLLRRSGNTAEQLLAQDYAMSLLDRWEIDRELASGVTDDEYRNWRVRTEIKEGLLPQATKAVFVVEIRIFAVSDGREMARVNAMYPLQ